MPENDPVALIEVPYSPGALSANTTTHLDLRSDTDVSGLRGIDVRGASVVNTSSDRIEIVAHGRTYSIAAGSAAELEWGFAAREVLIKTGSVGTNANELKLVFKGTLRRLV